ncbi:thioredoxin domain-containing protein 11 isoform X2 [Sinocyclocheilus rhinocerous]|uniref:thioredoxin domain-containing protein 11 isoform X2 n=1 Tax=Sinocyclocheilus rhinocerous TaxID=307959 RepID=UPI0007B90DDE|nr:PREDICTED: thioredoxin domain-containing protein 11 isoform X2 [Sinocyclocheilus rhinocerous]
MLRIRAKLRQAADQMKRRPELCCGAILLTCALILPLTLTCSRVKSVVASPRAPLRFFPAEAPLADLFLGQLEEVDRLLEEADVSLVFYYAPWCAHCITARQHIQQVALRLAQQVQFVAVNCWWHQGRCRKQKIFFQYPVIHLFYRRVGPIEYRGPVRSEYLESFIQRVCAPLTYLPSVRALHTFLTQHQAVVGYFRFSSSPQPAGYITFLLSALHALRRDQQGEVRFAVVTNQAVAEGVSLREDESVYLHRRLNSSLVFPRTQRNFTVQAVCDWVFENRESVIHWIQPTGAKSYSLEAELQKGPALLTFLPHNPLTANQLLTQVSAVALQYHCGSEEDLFPRCCQSLSFSSDASVCELCVSRCWALALYLQRVSLSSCRSVQSSYGAFGRWSVCCRSVPRPPLDSITGLQCRSNKTLRFYLLDTQLHWPLAQRLGASADQSRDLPFITIINLRDETHYVLNHTDALEDFIQNFSATYSPLHRHLVGHKQQQQTQSLIQEVTSDSFLHTVMDSQRDVLLLYYSVWCGFCSVLNHVFLQLARLFQGNSALTVARVNVGRNDLPWEFMVDHLPSVLFFPRHRKQMSVKFPENTPMTVPNLLRFVLQHSDHAPWEESGRGAEPQSLLEAELQALQRQVFSLHRARERLSQQLSVLWRENRRLTLHTHTLETQNAELQEQSGRLETLYREKTRQLSDTVHRLQELADASEELLEENSLLKVLLTVLRERDGWEGDSRDTDGQEEADGQEEDRQEEDRQEEDRQEEDRQEEDRQEEDRQEEDRQEEDRQEEDRQEEDRQEEADGQEEERQEGKCEAS